MAKVWEYPRWRYAAMQVIMWIILLGVVGLAVLTNSHLRQAMRVDLGQEITDGPMRFMMPKGWDVQPEIKPGLSRYQALEPGEEGRTLIVSRQQVDGTPQPIDYLLAANPELRLAVTEFGVQRVHPQAVVISGLPGLRVTEQFSHIDDQGNRVPFKSLMACVVLSSGEAIEIQLRGLGHVDGRDEELLRQEIESMKLTVPPPPAG